METSRVARIASILALTALALFVAGPLLTQLRAVDGFLGFRVFGVGILFGLIALVLGLLGLVFTRASAYRAGRPRARLGAAVGALIVAVTVAVAGPGAGVPAINDITTSPDDPPAFSADPTGKGRDMSYPAGFAEQQRAGYPDLAPIAVAAPPSETLTRVASLFESFGWRVTRTDPATGTLEATDTSKLFRFVDDIVVRVRPQGTGSVVDMRSKSRVGKGDLGANAKRIRRLAAALAQP